MPDCGTPKSSTNESLHSALPTLWEGLVLTRLFGPRIVAVDERLQLFHRHASEVARLTRLDPLGVEAHELAALHFSRDCCAQLTSFARVVAQFAKPLHVLFESEGSICRKFVCNFRSQLGNP